MDRKAAPPWRSKQMASVVPAKRSADTQEAEWVAKEDIFVLNQAKKKAEIRVREGRARPIDWLAVTLRVIDPSRDALDDETAEAEVNVVDPEGVFEGLDDASLTELEKDIDTYVALERSQNNRDYWNTMKIICRDRRQKSQVAAPEGRTVSSVSGDVDRLLGPKSYEELELLEKQILKKLESNEPVDVDYWEQLLRSLGIWKARAKLKRVYQSVVEKRLLGLWKQQAEEAAVVRQKLQLVLAGPQAVVEAGSSGPQAVAAERRSTKLTYSRDLDPEPLLKMRGEDKGLEVVDERKFLETVVGALDGMIAVRI